MILSKDQAEALDKMNSGRNIFLTGRAGTGKSTVINKFIEDNKKKRILTYAPTGLAAINVKGVTLHRGFKLSIHLDDILSDIVQVPKYLFKADVIIIDEISMCRIDIFEAVIKIIQRLNFSKRANDEDPVQLIVVGDFFQLPPVCPNSEKKILENRFGESLFCFNSPLWKEMKFENIVLTTCMRQTDMNFYNALNLIRIGNQKGVQYINKFSNKKQIKDGIFIVGKNEVANKINQEELAKIDNSSKDYYIKTVGSVSENEINVDSILTLKCGARVMTVINGDGYTNGSMGEVIALMDDSVLIKLDSGDNVVVKKHIWEIYKYKENDTGEIEKEIIGFYEQLPIKLAYAITIHKSQGQTFDKVNLYPYAWDDGQLYVALSRSKSLEGLFLMNKIFPNYLKTSMEVYNFYSKITK